ncbi:MAG: hypothetical protein ACFFD1_10460 [Candidatus Thorarchaeota archaeon]
MKEKPFSLKTGEIIKNSIIYLVFRYGGLTAKEIQKKLGLKRQTTYNYLNELVEHNEINTKEEFLDSNPNVKTLIYTYNRRNPEPIQYKIRFSELFKNKTANEIRQELNYQINISIASLIEAFSFINSIDDKKLVEYAVETYSPIGPGMDMITLSDEEFEELGKGFEELLKNLWSSWRKRPTKGGNNLFLAGGFKAFFKDI